MIGDRDLRQYLTILCAAMLFAPPALAAECRIVVLDLAGKNLSAAEHDLPSLLTESLAQEVSTISGCTVVTQGDVAQMMDFEATRQQCGAESESCLAEIGSALGADRIVAGTLGKLGSEFVLSARLMNVAGGTVEKRGEQVVPGAPEQLRVAARNLGRQLFGVVPLPPASAAPARVATVSTTTSGPGWIGLGVGAAGALTAAAGAVALGMADGALGDPTTTDKDSQRRNGQIGAAVGAGGVVVAVAGIVAACVMPAEVP